MTGMTAEQLDEVAFDRTHKLVKAALARRATPDADFEVRTETTFHGLWLCGRCGENTEASLCPTHDTAWILLDYFENWTLTDRGAAAGHCGPCANDGTRTDVTTRVCSTHGLRRRDPYRSLDYKPQAWTSRADSSEGLG
ncbi:hypothetical protein C8D87_114111 [Lentzea atacamensis]|uniref:HNH endonuclease n=1 Tax=Lentzea atacamensis TaxID=531938 RepID=A0ABX9DW29_9PSEU|nr:hypothetical protein [Lentzea atacamensis]RAS59499.1 hypothetical protein C8D87_114111 [Lentzea atacamensis]